MALLEAWAQAAADEAGVRGAELRAALADPLDRFRLAVRGTASGRKSKGAARASRRIVTAAIDRISDAFLAIDVHDATIVDANPAAGALLGVARDALLGLEFGSFVPEGAGSAWWTALDAIAESSDCERFHATLRDVAGIDLQLEASATRFSTRGRTLSLTLLRVAEDRSS